MTTLHTATWLIDEYQKRVTQVKVLFDHEPSDDELNAIRYDLERVVYGMGIDSLAEKGEGLTVSQGDWDGYEVDVFFGDVEAH